MNKLPTMNKTTLQLTALFLVFGIQFSLGQREPAPGTTVDYNNVSMPESPTASAFNAVGKTNVNTATGIPSISIPLYTYELDGVKVPVALSYNASGVKVGEMATSVGLNWSLEAGGQISRTVRGKTDEWEGWLDDDYTFLSDGWYSGYNPSSPDTWQDAMKGRAETYYYGYAKTNDHNPDLFSYSFPGGSGTYIHTSPSHTPAGAVLKEKQDGITLSPLNDGGYNTGLSAEDLQGNSYSFNVEDTERSSNELVTSSNWDLTEDFFSWEGENGFDPITAWKLSKITTKNNKEIHFEYQNEAMYYTLNGTSYHISIGHGCEISGAPEIKAWNKTNTTYDFNTRLIKKIWSPDSHIEINFNYTSDTGLPDTVWKTKLTSIVISDQITGRVKEFRFTYTRYSGEARLKLTGVQEVGYDAMSNEVVKPPYTFTYNTTALPEKDSHKEDFFGYYNNASGNGMVPELDGLPSAFQSFFDNNSQSRSLNSGVIQAGILTTITYPTGGQTHFEYEPNAIGGKYCGGLRIKSIEDTDETGTYHRKTYQYSDLIGFNLEDNLGLIMKTEGETTSYYSNFVTLPGDQISGYKTGYFYKKVTVTSFHDTENFKEEFVYKENTYALHRYDYALKSHTSFKGSQPVKLVEYVNNLVGTPQTIYWNVLGDMMCYGGANSRRLGYSDTPRVVNYQGNYSYMPTKVATTEYLKRGSVLKPVTTYKETVYDPTTLLKTQEIVDFRRRRDDYDDYPVEEGNEERITTTYKYPWDPTINVSLPEALPMKIATVSLQNSSSKISGQDFEYDSNGNIKRTYQYNKGEGSNTSSLPYIESDYEHMNTFQFEDGKPVQVVQKDGVPVSYIWGYKGQLPVAKIEGKLYNTINSSLITAIQNASDSGNETNLSNALDNLRTALAGESVMITTYTHHPLAGVHTITDPKGDTTTYHYDALGRLMYVTDKQGRRLKENEYNYGQ